MSDAILFGRTQVAFQTPFESNPERVNGFVSKNVQEAIEEALALAVANDRFVIFPFYNGNANSGRYLELWPGIATDVAPLDVGNVPLKCIFINSHTTAANATCTIGYYDIAPAIPVLLYTTTFVGVKEVINQGTPLAPLFTLPANGNLAIKIDSGSINRPYLLLSLSASL